LEDIFIIDINDNITYKIVSISEIRLEDPYPGYRINVLATMEALKIYLQIDFTTGDIITPREIEYGYNSIFENKKIYILSYRLETVIAEKLESCIRRNIFNTRMKDFYDLYKINLAEIDADNLFKAVRNTFKKRETNFDIDYFKHVIYDLKNSGEFQKRWLNYVDNTPYASNILFEDLFPSLEKIIEILEKQFIGV
jgi:hypothetical protein